jgi:DNA-nicking Smr family endonuclease
VKEDTDNPIELPVDGTLDLHVFAPREIKNLLRDYLAACRRKGILDVRIIHGKGTGALRRTVHAVLDRMDEVMSYTLAGDASSWGATVVKLKPTLRNREEDKRK